MREIRMLRAMWRALETESRSFLNGHEGGNAGYSQGTSYGFTRQRSTLPGRNREEVDCRSFGSEMVLSMCCIELVAVYARLFTT